MCAVAYPGELRVLIVYNTPSFLPVQKELHEMTKVNGRAVRAACIQDSRSKAHNLEYALAEITEEVSPPWSRSRAVV